MAAGGVTHVLLLRATLFLLLVCYVRAVSDKQFRLSNTFQSSLAFQRSQAVTGAKFADDTSTGTDKSPIQPHFSNDLPTVHTATQLPPTTTATTIEPLNVYSRTTTSTTKNTNTESPTNNLEKSEQFTGLTDVFIGKTSTVTKSPGNKATTVTKLPGNKATTVTKLPGKKATTVTKSPGNKATTVSKLPRNKATTVTKSSGKKATTVTKLPGNKATTVTKLPGNKATTVPKLPVNKATTIPKLPVNKATTTMSKIGVRHNAWADLIFSPIAEVTKRNTEILSIAATTESQMEKESIKPSTTDMNRFHSSTIITGLLTILPRTQTPRNDQQSDTDAGTGTGTGGSTPGLNQTDSPVTSTYIREVPTEDRNTTNTNTTDLTGLTTTLPSTPGNATWKTSGEENTETTESGIISGEQLIGALCLFGAVLILVWISFVVVINRRRQRVLANTPPQAQMWSPPLRKRSFASTHFSLEDHVRAKRKPASSLVLDPVTVRVVLGGTDNNGDIDNKGDGDNKRKRESMKASPRVPENSSVQLTPVLLRHYKGKVLDRPS